jgi:RNA-directed DNA polymerase
MSKLATLKSAATLSDLAPLLDFQPSKLAYVVFKQAAATKYRTFEIPKRKGGTRTINAPIDALKTAQQKLSTLLQDCVDEINEATGRKDRAAHGFKRQRSIITNARKHRNRRYVFNIDLENFFPSINFGRVRGYFIKDKNFALHERVATAIAQLACHNQSLPQGSPCSPVISNLIAHILDMRLVHLASTVGCTYSRYADDLTFSTNKKEFPLEIAEPSKAEPHLWTPGIQLQKLIKYSGFQINPTKTHMQYRTSRQEVTGLVVNRKINVRHEYRHTVRAMVHTLLRDGSFKTYAATVTPGNTTLEKKDGTLNQLHGMLGFIDKIDLYNRACAKGAKDSEPLSKKELMYQRFLIYRNFFVADTPVVLCEGETDNVYLTHAIRSLANDYPDLASKGSDGKIHLKIRLYKYRRSSTARILGLGDGGSGVLSKFIPMYKKETAKFKAPGQEHPVVVLYDNDSGASPIRSVVKQACGTAPNGTEPFIHVVRNLYALATPLPNGTTQSKIEDFFEAKLKATVIDNKTFNDQNQFDTSTQYGKSVFAHKVVRPSADTINFNGFRPLLTNLVLAIKAHAVATSVSTPTGGTGGQSPQP